MCLETSIPRAHVLEMACAMKYSRFIHASKRRMTCHGSLFYAKYLFVLEFQTRFWFSKTTPARASVRGLEFDSGLFETKHLGV